MDQSATPTTGRNKKACTECRQQKARCDAHLVSPRPCSRCQKMNVQCVISDPFKRQNKRQRLSELEREATLLRQELNNGQNHGQTSESAQLANTAEIRTNSVSNGEVSTNAGSSTQTVSSTIQVRSRPQSPHSPLHDSRRENIREDQTSDLTVMRTLDGVQVDADTIDGIFQTYFQRYNHFMPILDPLETPNWYYKLSPFLFWAIIGVACRAYTAERTLLDSLAPKITNLALTSLNPKHTSLRTIKGLLLVLNWPFPTGSLSQDIPFPLSGGMLHMAMQMGLHVPLSSQEFSRVKISLTEDDINKRSELWANCVLVYQRACNCIGLAHLGLLDLGLLDASQKTERDQTPSLRISPSLRFQLKIHGIVTRCCTVVQEHGLRTLSAEQERSLDIILRVFEAQLADAEAGFVTDIDLFYFYTCRLTVQMFYFFKNPASLHVEAVIRLYTSACQLVDYMEKLDQDRQILATSPFYFNYAMILASHATLRIMKSSFAQYLDPVGGKSTFFRALDLGKRLATENCRDLASRNTLTLTQLWNSKKAFKRPNGTEYLSLRIRSRLAMSPVYDTAWWWREEFGGQMGAYLPPTDETRQSSDGNQGVNAAMVSNHESLGFGMQEPDFLDDNFLAEFGWTYSGSDPFSPLMQEYGPESFSASNDQIPYTG